MQEALHVVTPLWKSSIVGARLGSPAFLKMEAFQPAWSFKIRGLGQLCQAAQADGASRLVCASGGNAGLATAYAGRKLGLPTTVVVPERTGPRARQLIVAEGAELIAHGDVWDDAQRHADELAAQNGAAVIHPFDDPTIWAGHATMIEEAASQGPKPGAVIVSVGGGGLLCGVLEGMHRVGWQDIPVLAVETEGAASYAAALAAGMPVELKQITSIAVTLGARRVCNEAVAWAQRHEIIPWLVSDRAALEGSLRFADDHRVLVEPACGAALIAAYDAASPLVGRGPVLVIVCGGAGVTLGQLAAWQGQMAER